MRVPGPALSARYGHAFHLHRHPGPDTLFGVPRAGPGGRLDVASPLPCSRSVTRGPRGTASRAADAVLIRFWVTCWCVELVAFTAAYCALTLPHPRSTLPGGVSELFRRTACHQTCCIIHLLTWLRGSGGLVFCMHVSVYSDFTKFSECFPYHVI